MPTNEREGRGFIFTLLKALRRRKKHVFLTTALCSALTAAYAISFPDRIRAQALLAAEPRAAQEHDKTLALRANAPTLRRQMDIIREALCSRPVIEKAVAECGLDKGPDTLASKWAQVVSLSLFENLWGGQPASRPDSARSGEREQLLDEVRSRIHVRVEDADEFYIVFEGSDAQEAVDVTNRLADLFIKRTLAKQDRHAEEATWFLSTQVEQLRNRLAGIDDRIRQYSERGVQEPSPDRLTRDDEATRTQNQSPLERQREARLDERLERMNKVLNFRIIEPAHTPQTPFIPRRYRILLGGFFASLGLGLVAAFVAEQIDNSFEGVDDFQRFTNLPVLTAVPGIPGNNAGTAPAQRSRMPGLRVPEPPGPIVLDRNHLRENRIVTLAAPALISAEQYGILALKLRQRLKGEGSNVLTVTSASGGEGKTLTAINLAIALASSVEGRVLLVDADLRLPRVHEYLGLRPLKGFRDLLSDPTIEAQDLILKAQDLYLLPGGPSLPNPLAILASRRAHNVIAGLRQEFQFIVLDAPPILPMADSHVLAGLSDGVLLVVRARQTRRELFQRAVESLDASNVIGVALNDVDYWDPRYIYAYEYYKKHYAARH